MSPWVKQIVEWAAETLPTLLEHMGPDRAHLAIEELGREYRRYLSDPSVRTDLTIRGANLPDLSARVVEDRAEVDAILEARRKRGPA